MRLVSGGALILLLSAGCSSGETRKDSVPVITTPVKDRNWQEQMEYISSLENPAEEKTAADLRFLLTDASVLAGVKATVCGRLAELKTPGFRKETRKLLNHADPMVRFKCLLYLETQTAEAEDVDLVAERFRDPEWTVRETAFRMLRNYSAEKDKKKYYLQVVVSLNEKEGNTLREIYRSLAWYEDAKSFPYLFRRSYHTRNNFELLIIMNELANFKGNQKVRRRLQQISIQHHDIHIRAEARRLMAEI